MASCLSRQAEYPILSAIVDIDQIRGTIGEHVRTMFLAFDYHTHD